MDCSSANSFISSLNFLLFEVERLYWFWVMLWAIVLVRKIFYA